MLYMCVRVSLVLIFFFFFSFYYSSCILTTISLILQWIWLCVSLSVYPFYYHYCYYSFKVFDFSIVILPCFSNILHSPYTAYMHCDTEDMFVGSISLQAPTMKNGWEINYTKYRCVQIIVLFYWFEMDEWSSIREMSPTPQISCKYSSKYSKTFPLYHFIIFEWLLCYINSHRSVV